MIFPRKHDRQRSPFRPIGRSRAGFNQTYPIDRISLRQLRSVAMNRVRALIGRELVASNAFLSCKLLINEFASNAQRGTRRVSHGLSSAKANVAWGVGSSGKQHFPVAVQHHERRANV